MKPLTDLLERPQPVGLFPLPAGYLLLPPTSDRQAAAQLLRGDVPILWPKEWQFFAAALAGNHAAALEQLPDGPLGVYNRLVLSPSIAVFQQASASPLRPLAEVIGFSLGWIDQPPPIDELDGELLAHVLAVHAAAAWARHDASAAERHLQTAIAAARTPSPLLAAQLLGQLAAFLKTDRERWLEACTHYRHALQLAADTPLIRLRAGLWFALGTTYHEHAQGHRTYWLEAINAYQQAIACGLAVDCHPELYAEVHNNLGLAYLSIPATAASDPLRMAVAIQSFREALKVFTRDSDPARWASTTLNFANALQYLPSGHPADNLWQAVELYDAVLRVRTRADDPVGYARVLANQANALAHLGQFAAALEKLNEAYKLFQWYEDAEAAAGVMELVESITAARAANPAAVES
ncbi:MAG: tetratricopeptide repeat protein [Gemmataceae bacterium]|nr:tetratricopeptide repeat protein [Gemmata sp.]MDW8196968.1 tetratricopeptide repeat protein [Gemmataceae bacterium]